MGEGQTALDMLRHSLITAPVLGYLNLKKTKVLDPDSSRCGVGVVLSQQQGNQERVIAYYNKTLTPSEQNYCVTCRELLAVVKAVKTFRPFLYKQEFWFCTAHVFLQWLCRRRESSLQVELWLEVLAEFEYMLKHCAIVKQDNANDLS